MTSSEDEESNSRTEDNSESSFSRPVWQLMYFLLMWQALYRVSNAALKVLLKFLSLYSCLAEHLLQLLKMNPSADLQPKYHIRSKIVINSCGTLREMILSLTLFVPSVILSMSMMIVLSPLVIEKSPKNVNILLILTIPTFERDKGVIPFCLRKLDQEEATNFLQLKPIHIYHSTNL